MTFRPTPHVKREDFDHFCRVRERNRLSTFDVGGLIRETGLDEDDVRYIIANYRMLLAEFHPEITQE